MKHILWISAIALATLTSCNTTPTQDVPKTQLDVTSLKKATAQETERLVAQFIEAKEGSTIDIPAGFFEMNTQLILDKVNNITIKGRGMYETVISFKTIKTGGEGMKIGGNNVTLEGFTVIDAPGDCIKTQNCDGLTFRNINTTWSHTDLSKSGTYGIYPVQCKNILVEKCEVSNSRDAGIYVGQSENIIVKDCYVHENVAGIEIENSDNAEVFNNRAENNTAGILVFNLPGLPKAFGTKTKIYNNNIKNNNHVNFAVPIGTNPGATEAAAQNGNAVTMVPPGSGIIILAGADVEVYKNTIAEHKTAGIMIASYHFTGLPIPKHEGWSPYTSNISVHNNTIQRPAQSMPDTTKDSGKLIAAFCQATQDIVYDGVIDVSKGKDINKNPMNVCINESLPDLRFSRFVLPADGDMTKMQVSNDIKLFSACQVQVKTDVGHLLK